MKKKILFLLIIASIYEAYSQNTIEYGYTFQDSIVFFSSNIKNPIKTVSKNNVLFGDLNFDKNFRPILNVKSKTLVSRNMVTNEILPFIDCDECNRNNRQICDTINKYMNLHFKKEEENIWKNMDQSNIDFINSSHVPGININFPFFIFPYSMKKDRNNNE